MAVLFVLDQNFPAPVVDLDWPEILSIAPLDAIDPTLTAGVLDWQVLLALEKLHRVRGFITNDAKMLRQTTEMVVLAKSHLTMVVTEGVGHDSLRATGLLMTYLPEIAAQTGGHFPHLYVLTPNKVARLHKPLPDLIERLATKHGLRPDELIAMELAKIQAPL